MTVTLDDRFKLRRGTAANLASVNEVPLQGEIVYETDQGLTDGKYKIKIGDGVTHYNDLAYVSLGGGVESVVPGGGIAVDATDPKNPVVSSTLGGVESVVPGDGVAVNNADPKNPIVSSTLGSIALAGRVAAYANLPTSGLSPGAAYYVESDGLIYIWNGSAFPAAGAGVNFSSNPFASDPYAAFVTSLKRFKAGVPLCLDDVNGPWGNHSNPPAPLSGRGMECAGDKGIYSASNNSFIVRVGELATVDLWFIADDNTRGNLATTRPISASFGWLIRREANGAIIISDIGGGSYTTPTGVVPPGILHFIRVRYTATQCQLFVNGVAKGSFTRTTYAASADPVTLGYSVSTVSPDSLKGAIKSFRFTQGYARDGAEVPPVFF